MKNLEKYIYSIPDFPKPGILFRDVTGVLDSGDGLRLAIDALTIQLTPKDFDVVAGIESRGFIFGAPIAYKFGTAFVPVRKPGKLPRATIRQDYELEYGKAAVEIHADAIKPGQKVVIVDDLLATGGTAEAAAKLVERLGGEVVKILVIMELAGLEGRKLLEGYDISTLITYEGK